MATNIQNTKLSHQDDVAPGKSWQRQCFLLRHRREQNGCAIGMQTKSENTAILIWNWKAGSYEFFDNDFNEIFYTVFTFGQTDLCSPSWQLFLTKENKMSKQN